LLSFSITNHSVQYEHQFSQATSQRSFVALLFLPRLVALYSIRNDGNPIENNASPLKTAQTCREETLLIGTEKELLAFSKNNIRSL